MASPDLDSRREQALAASIVDYAAGGYPVDRVVPSTCGCGGRRFAVLLNDDVGVAVRVCSACGAETAMLDSDDHFDDVDSVEEATCTCGGREFLVATGFSLADDENVRWVAVGLVCVDDGVAGVYTDWKIDYAPSAHLLTAV